MIDIDDLIYSVHHLSKFTRNFALQYVDDPVKLPITCLLHSTVMKKLLSDVFPNSTVRLVSGVAGWQVGDGEHDSIAFDPENTGDVLNKSDKTFNGHCWVEVDGIIVDVMAYTFPTYMLILNSLDGGDSKVSKSFPFTSWIVTPKGIIDRRSFFRCVPPVGSFFYEETSDYIDIIDEVEKQIVSDFGLDSLSGYGRSIIDRCKQADQLEEHHNSSKVTLSSVIAKYRDVFFDPLMATTNTTRH